MSARRSSVDEPLAEVDRAVRQFFEPQLRALGLTTKQIEEQDLPELESSRERINDAIANPDSFGKVRLSLGVSSGRVTALIAARESDAIIERGVLPILLEQKALILDRIKELRSEQQLTDLRADVVDKVEDPQVREQMLNIVNSRFEEERAARESLDRERAKVEDERVAVWEREQRVRIELRERRWAIYRSFIARESMASVIGAILLLALAAVLIVGMFTHTSPPAVVTNAFLLILGYFFGQTTTQARIDREPKGNDT
jgi:uncharacterized membrane protein